MNLKKQNDYHYQVYMYIRLDNTNFSALVKACMVSEEWDSERSLVFNLGPL